METAVFIAYDGKRKISLHYFVGSEVNTQLVFLNNHSTNWNTSVMLTS